MPKEIWVYSDFHDPADFGLLGKAAEFARRSGGQAAAVTRSDPPDQGRLFHCGADILYHIHAEGSETIQALALTHLCQKYHPQIVLFSASLVNSVIAARAAAHLGAGLSADCTDFVIDQNLGLIRTRPAYGGKLIAEISGKSDCLQMATVRPGAFPAVATDPRRSGIPIDFIPQNLSPDPLALLSSESISMMKNLRDSRIIVSGGKGIGSPEGFGLLQMLADRIGGVVGASRSAVDADFAGYESQVGQTGLSVSPELYIAFAISGAPQHIAGIRSAKKIIAVNRDPSAPIFDYADLAIVSDWKVVIAELLRVLSSE